jgi:hypothetical protein
MHIAKKYFSFGGLDKKKAGWERIRNAKNSHSSLLLGGYRRRPLGFTEHGAIMTEVPEE